MKIVSFIFAMIFVMLFTACGKTDIKNSAGISGQTRSQFKEEITKSSESGKSKEIENDEQKKILIAYFSWAENAIQDDLDAMTSASVTQPGNVAQLALWIEEETGGELFSIQVKEPYPADWNGCLKRANQEKADGIHPVLIKTVDNIAEYDIIYLGYPKMEYGISLCI